MRQVETLLNDLPSMLAEIKDLEITYRCMEPNDSASVVEFSWDHNNGNPTELWGIKRAEIKMVLDAYKKIRDTIHGSRRKMEPQERKLFDMYYGGRISAQMTMRALGVSVKRFRVIKHNVNYTVWESCRKSAGFMESVDIISS